MKRRGGTQAHRLHYGLVVLLGTAALLVAQLPAAPGALAGHAGLRAAALQPATAQPQAVWQLSPRTFAPGSGADTVSQTFTPSTTCYQVGVVVIGGQSGDNLIVRLGASSHDESQVMTGEQHYFAACHLQAGVMPVLHAIPDSKHDYGSRTLTYAVGVYLPLAVPQSVDGISTGSSSNTLLLQVSRADDYTVHLHLSTGTMQVWTVSGSTTTTSVKISGDGGFRVKLPIGLVRIKLQPAAAQSATITWTAMLGIAPRVSDFKPANGDALKHAPANITAHADATGQLVLDRKAVASSYDATTGTISFTPTVPLAAGIHILEVAGPDGTLATRHATFRVLPSLTAQPPSTPGGTADGVAWVHTTTPDGRYQLSKPADWQMAGEGGTVLLANAKGSALVVLSERLLGSTIDASTMAAKVPGTPQFGTLDGGVSFSATVAGKKGSHLALLCLVLPSPQQNSLMLAVGLSKASSAALGKQVTGIISSLSANDDAGVQKARTWTQYQQAGFNLQYPNGWMADFTATGSLLLAGPSDQAYLLGEGIAYSGPTTAADMATTGQQVVALIKAQVHGSLQVQSGQSGSGIYRWLGTYTSADGKTAYLELGQVIAANGRLQLMWGDTSAELAPSNVPILAYSLDSAAQAAGVTPPLAFTVAAAIQQVTAQLPATLLQGKTPAAGQTTGNSNPESSTGTGTSSQNQPSANQLAASWAESNLTVTMMQDTTTDFINGMDRNQAEFLQSEGYDADWYPSYNY